MELTFECPKCQTVGRAVLDDAAATVICARCGEVRGLYRASFSDGKLSACAWCATEDLYIQKDFPHGLGLSIVFVGFIVSSIFWYYLMPISAFAVLLGTAAFDAVLYYLVPDVTICYRCLSQHRGAGANANGHFRLFDLAIGERYRQERLRAEELRQQRRSSVESS